MTYDNQRVLLVELVERTSKNGRVYMSGFMGKARLYAQWRDGTDRDGQPARYLDVYACEHQPRQEQAPRPVPRPSTIARQQERQAERQRQDERDHDELNDPLPEPWA